MAWWTVFLALLLAFVVGGAETVAKGCVGANALRPSCPSSEAQHQRDVFYVGGRYIPFAGGNILVDQLYVEKLVPASGIRQPYPLVFFHGGGPSGVVSSTSLEFHWANMHVCKC